MKLTLDSYISFVESDDKFDFTVEFINQILHSHGFKKIYKTPKKVVVEAVESIKLMNPSRMTLRQNISAGPVISNNEANSDIKYLDWFECSNCSVTSVQSHSVNAEALTSTALVLYEGDKEDDTLIQSDCKSAGKQPVAHSSPVKSKKRRKPERRSDDHFVYFH